MKTEAVDPLLSAVLPGDAAFRDAALRRVLAQARRRRARVIRRSAGIGAAIACAAFVLRLWLPDPAPEMHRSAETVAITHTAPLSADELVHTRGGFFASIESLPAESAGLAFTATTPGGLDIVETRLAAPPLEYLSDQQLLAAFPGRRPALIDLGTDRARLIFY
jgi:hypothetical protein